MPLLPIFVARSGRVAAVVAVLGLAACAAVPQKPAEDVVRARAQERWDALLKGDLKAAYGYLGPGSRELNTFEAYSASVRKGFWKTAQVSKVACPTAESCEVEVAVEYEFRGSRVKTPLGETWVRQEGNWWYVLK